MRRAFGLGLVLTVAVPASAQVPRLASIPLCSGLRVVTAVNDKGGDYESIKTVEDVSGETVRINYSSEAMVQDLFDLEPTLRRTNVTRILRRTDLASATAYLQRFTEYTPDLVPGTTAIGTSAAVLSALRKTGRSRLAVFGFFADAVPLDRNVHPNLFDYEMATEVMRAGNEDVRVTVNGRLVDLPALHVTGNFFGDESEFFFLDDPANPLTLRFRIGIRPPDPARVELAKAMGEPPPTSGDRETLRVVRISYGCEGPPLTPGAGTGAGAPGAGGGLPATGAGGGSLERALSESGRVEVYDIFFTFNSADIRPESEPTLREIGELLTRHADWRLTIAGHTDSIASDQYNLDLSNRRAAAVKNALVTRYGIATARLMSVGYGERQPKDTNDTLEGRARNRRVELVRTP